MPPYDLINLKYTWLILGVGLGLALLIVLARGATSLTLSLRKRSAREIEEDVHEFGGQVRERNGPVPLLLWVLIAAVLIWAVGYTIHSGVHGL